MNEPVAEIKKTDLADLEERTMTIFEARECVDKINSNIRNTRALLLDLYEKKGWEALGYESWRACVIGEFKGKERYFYKQLQAAQVEKNICPNGQKSVGTLAEGTIRPLTRIKDPDQQREVYQQAVETAPDGKVTAQHIENTIENMKQKGGDAEHVEKVKPAKQKDSKELANLKLWWWRARKGDRKAFQLWIKKQEEKNGKKSE